VTALAMSEPQNIRKIWRRPNGPHLRRNLAAERPKSRFCMQIIG
jgi:hypothetical protein